jgi:hypothetical protein
MLYQGADHCIYPVAFENHPPCIFGSPGACDLGGLPSARGAGALPGG